MGRARDQAQAASCAANEHGLVIAVENTEDFFNRSLNNYFEGGALFGGSPPYFNYFWTGVNYGQNSAGRHLPALESTAIRGVRTISVSTTATSSARACATSFKEAMLRFGHTSTAIRFPRPTPASAVCRRSVIRASSRCRLLDGAVVLSGVRLMISYVIID